MEPKSVKKLGAPKPARGIKVIDLAAKRMGPKKPKGKRLRSMGTEV